LLSLPLLPPPPSRLGRSGDRACGVTVVSAARVASAAAAVLLLVQREKGDNFAFVELEASSAVDAGRCRVDVDGGAS
jgi:hypothetical protein